MAKVARTENKHFSPRAFESESECEYGFESGTYGDVSAVCWMLAANANVNAKLPVAICGLTPNLWLFKCPPHSGTGTCGRV